ncbi:MAG TPA: MFS transporter [Polyangia bacterium]|nr:MFS transporter [Polyangia bacterium]
MSVVPAAVPSGARARRGLAPLPLLTAINFVNYFDRQIMYGLFPLVGKDMNLSDTALGALGFGNLLVFALSSIISGPATRRFGPRRVVATGVIVWSLATLGSALAPSYAFLLVMRALVGVGEGAFGPSANALLCADAPPERRGRAMGIFNVGMALGGAGGGAFALLAAGVLSPYITWRGSLLIAGLPGFLLALASARMALPAQIPAPPRLPARRYLLSRVYVTSVVAGALANFGAGAIIAWMPTLMLRERLIAPTVASIYLGLVAIVCGAGGVLAGGYAGDALSRRVRAGHALVVGVSFIASVPVGLVALFIPSQLMFLALTAVAAFLFSVYNGPIAAAVDEMGPRAYATTLQANFLLIVTLCGNSPASLVTGRASDLLKGHAASPLATALVGAMAAFLVSGILFVAVSRMQRRMPSNP